GVPGVCHHDRDGSSGALGCYRRPRGRSHDDIDLKTNQVCGKLRQTLKLLLGKPVLDGDIVTLDPSKLAHLLPERIHEDRATRSSACIQVTNAGDFACLLRLSERSIKQ